MALRAWSWTRIDGRNVLAVPTQTEIRLYDSDDFILLARLAPSGHRSPVAFVRWSAFHAKLASLSAELLLVHAPQRDAQSPDQDSGRGGVHFAAVCRLRLDAALGGGIRGLAFSRSADELLFCGRGAGLGKLSVKTGGDRGDDQALVLWKQEAEGCDMAKYSPSAFVFASLQKQEREVKVWRMQRRLGDSDENQKLDRVEVLQHPDPVVYFSWKPSTTQWHSALETDGTRKAQWFEPARILLTCTATRSVRIWTEKEAEHGEVWFLAVLVFEPTYPIDNVRWVLSKNRNISDENFQVVNDVHDKHADWISGVDHTGILRLWRVVGVVSNEPTVEETTLQIKVNGEDDSKKGVDMSVRLREVCVMAYFSQNYFGMPSKLGIVLQRADHIMMSFHVAVGEGDRPSQILKKSWYRSHLGSISALSAHPSLPLIASVDAHPSQHDGTWRNEILVYWISFSAFSAESRLIPSGVLPCAKDSGEVLCIQWVPTLHFDATPILLVAFESGIIDVYGRSARADVAVVSSPRVQLPLQHRRLTRSPSLSPWTFYDYVTGESGYEYEVACEKPTTSSELGIQFEEKRGKLLVSRNISSNKYASEVVEGDELVGINNKSVVGKDVEEVYTLIDTIPHDESLLMRFRAACVQNYQGTMGPPAYATFPQSTTLAPLQPSFTNGSGGEIDSPEHSVEEYASELRRSFLSSMETQNPQSPHATDNVVNAGAVSMYGGWKQLLHVEAAPKLSLLCVCPAYADDGEYIPDSVVIFGEKDTSLAGDRASYEFSRAFKDATQMLKLLAKVMDDEPSARASATSGVLSYTGPERARRVSAKENGSGRARMLESIGRYSTSIHRSGNIDKAENLFAAPASSQRTYNYDEDDLFAENDDQDTLASTEAATILAAVDSMLLGRRHPLQANASILFASFSEEHLLEMKALLSFVEATQSLGFDLDASAADLGAKRFFSMLLFAKSLRSVVLAHSGNNGDLASNPQNGDSDPFSGKLEWRNSFSERDGCFWLPNLEETPSSGLLWALHSDAQQFLWEHCIQPTMQWDDIRPMWLGLWIKDAKDLRGIVERFAKASYARTKDAMDVCLFYVALGKQKVLSVLAKLTQSESNKVLASFLENDFSDKRWSNAAIKNAYSLLSKKRYEAAAAFFLLCDPPHVQDAIRVLSVRLGDPSLALIISRLVEYRLDDKLQNNFTMNQAGITPAGDVTKQLLEQDVVPLFRLKREVWLESCALWWLEEFEQSWAVLLPQFQDVDVRGSNELILPMKNGLVSSVMQATHFYINLTSLTVYFQHLHSSVNSTLLSWAKKKMQQQAFPDAPVSPVTVSSGKKRLQLASTADIEHAFAFAAYVCKRSGLSDTALVEMLQARHLINLHARFEISTIETGSNSISDLLLESEVNGESGSPTSPRFQSSVRTLRRETTLSFITSPLTGKPPRHGLWSASPRRMSFADKPGLLHIDPVVSGMKSSRQRASSIALSKALQSEKTLPTAPWLKAQIADIECRRWASSAFVGKMIGIRVAREMISHFRSELDMWFRHGDGIDSPTHAMTITTTPRQRHHHRVKLHREFLDELCTPLCEQFQVDRNYVYEAALAVMHPHAYLHIVEVCFLLSELNRVSTLRKWVEYVSLSMLHSCSTFASCSIAEDVYRDWEGLTIQLCYILNLDAQGQISIPPRVIAHISVAVRTGIIFLGWAGQRSDIVRQAVSLPFYTYGTTNVGPSGESSPSLSSFTFEKNLRLLCRLLQRPTANASETRKTRGFEGNLGYTFLGAVAARQTSDDNISLLSWGGIANAASQNQFKIRKMYTLILMVSVLRTLYARATVFLSTYQEGVDDDDDEVVEADISSSLFTPKKLWKALGEGPLEGLKRWYALIESHLRCEFDYSVKEVPCLCGLYGLDTAAFEEAAAANHDWKRQVSHECDGGTSDTSINSGAEDGNPIIDREDVINPKDISAPTTMETSEDDSPDSLKSFLREIGMSYELHTALVSASDDYVLLLMQNAKFGVRTTSRRFRVDPRVYVKSFVLRDAFSWFARHQIFSGDTKADTIAQIHAFLTRCCKQRKLRLLVAHRGEDTQMFPLDRCHPRPRHDSDVDADSAASVTSELPIPRSQLPSVVGSVTSEVPTSRSRLSSGAMGSEPSDSEPLPEALYLQSMMFVDPWEVEAEWNVRRYMHASQPPLHVELGWDRLSPICLETCDNIVDSAFEDPDLVAMWRTTGGEGWLVTAITQYRLDGLHSYRTLYQHIQRGLAGKEEPRIPLLVEIYSRSQRNAMFEEAGLPHRFIGAITVELVEAKDLIACSWIGKWSNAYVFLELSHAKDKPRETAEEWSLQTYRSPVGEGGVNPKWDTEENKFVFRFAIPTHGKHTGRPTTGVHFCNGEGGARRVDTETSRLASQLWNANVTDKNRAAVDALEKLLPSVFSGPPAMLRCTVYQKNKVLSHQFMGRAKVPLDELTSGNPMDCWLPLEDTSSGSLHVRISLSFQLMCSSMAGQEDLR
ncbi:hypothetical protein PF005_g6759 [Phytophthora fragariae]|uniref:Uncharacterized protein n=1 Tax=Phytophthora fragariae TaxID=53985 RepID=A0A6A3YQB2_9STRA|nr:hypothetical protein PF005_g6759 [Phytophthora fragariae]